MTGHTIIDPKRMQNEPFPMPTAYKTLPGMTHLNKADYTVATVSHYARANPYIILGDVH